MVERHQRSAFPEAPASAELQKGVVVEGADDSAVGVSPCLIV